MNHDRSDIVLSGGINPAIYEYLNLITGSLCIAASLVFVRYLIIEYRKGHLSFPTYVGLRHQMAVAVSFALIGEFGLRSWSWYARFALSIYIDATWMRTGWWNAVPIAFSAMQCVGLMCLARVFSPDEWKYYSWITFTVVSLLVFFRYWLF